MNIPTYVSPSQHDPLTELCLFVALLFNNSGSPLSVAHKRTGVKSSMGTWETYQWPQPHKINK